MSRTPNSPRAVADRSRLKTAAQHGVSAQILETKYLVHLSDPHDQSNPFWTWGYRAEIVNNTDHPVTVRARHWNIKPIGHAHQTTDGYGVEGEQIEIPAHDRKSYVSGLPLPTAKGGTIGGHYLVEHHDGNITEVIVEERTLEQAQEGALDRTLQNRIDAGQLNRQIDEYIAKCEQGENAILDTNDLPLSLQWSFQRLFLGMNGVTDFNSIKQSVVSKIEIGIELHIPLDVKSLLEYKDVFLYGSDFNNLRVRLIYYSDKKRLINEPLEQLLTSWGIPPHLHQETFADIERMAKERAKALLRPKWDERGKYAELKDLSAPSFLKKVYADEIAPDGTIQKEGVRKVDRKLMARVEGYISIREERKQDMGDAEGLRLVAGPRSRSKRASLE